MVVIMLGIQITLGQQRNIGYKYRLQIWKILMGLFTRLYLIKIDMMEYYMSIHWNYIMKKAHCCIDLHPAHILIIVVQREGLLIEKDKRLILRQLFIM